MIAYVNGDVVSRRDDYVVVQTSGGVGYHLAVSAETLSHVPAVGEPVSLHCHLVSRDDSIALFGFASEEERDLFLMLLGVQGVGPKVALACSAAARHESWRAHWLAVTLHGSRQFPASARGRLSGSSSNCARRWSGSAAMEARSPSLGATIRGESHAMVSSSSGSRCRRPTNSLAGPKERAPKICSKAR